MTQALFLFKFLNHPCIGTTFIIIRLSRHLPRISLHGIIFVNYAGMTELADVQDLGSCAVRRVGSTPTTRTSSPQARHSACGELFYFERGPVAYLFCSAPAFKACPLLSSEIEICSGPSRGNFFASRKEPMQSLFVSRLQPFPLRLQIF